VNRRTAPSLYLGVRPVTREATGSLAIAGSGRAVDWLVEMVRFDQETLFDRLAARHQLDVSLMEGLADAIVRFHETAEPRPDRGGRNGMAWVVDGNAQGLSEQGAAVFAAPAVERLIDATRAALGEHADLLERRRHGGLVRHCHGDLHLRNICLVSGTPTPFDAIEFNDDISCIDVMYDLAFLLMDLWRRDLRPHASAVFNEYVFRTHDLEGLALLPLFLSCRAAVRAKTSVTASAVQTDAARAADLHAAARQYLDLASQFLSPARPILVAIGGLSGTGKSTLARALAPDIGAAPGALVLRSDMIRKERFGVAPTTRLGPEGYAPEVGQAVYRTMVERARTALRAGHAVVADAVFASPSDRDAIAAAADDVGVPFRGFWLEAPAAALANRLRGRIGDASDATPGVLAKQLDLDTGPRQWRRLDASMDPTSVLHEASRSL
jgi:aminoglycoside phosphotransferase family enzyme